MTQEDQVRNYLNTGRALTPQQALRLFGIFRLAARIYRLKERYGEDSILSELTTKDGKRFATYHGTDLLKGRKAA